MSIYTKIFLVIYIALGAPIPIIILPVLIATLWARKRDRLGKGVLAKYWPVGATAVLSILLLFSVQNVLDRISLSQQAMNLVTHGWQEMTADKPDYQLAMKYNLAGVELNHPEGAANIGMLYENGWGVARDPIAAVEWYKKAIAMGSLRSAQADYQLAVLYENGIGITKDLAKAMRHYKEALIISTDSPDDPFYDEAMARLSTEGIKRVTH